ncbi:MAG TPA: ATP-binding protein, partial [Terriglobales bacterium]|nr:ATP-binding protein [Terriglobales bacterium]
AGGTSFTVQASLRGVETDMGRTICMVATDLTRLKQAEEQRSIAERELRKLNNELESRVARRTADLEALNRELGSFNYAIAHDLRGPLRHISGYAGLLADALGPGLGEPARTYLGDIQRGTVRMARLIEDLLNLARLGQQELHLQTCDLGRIVQDSIHELEPETQGRQIEWRVGKLPFVDCDPTLMMQVVCNLLSNALKFSKLRPVTVIEIGHRRTETEAEVFIKDNGVGFNMHYADKLFGIFQRLHRQEDFEGTGVGLAIVQRIIRRHGGRVWAQSELNHGATFFFTLPVTSADSVTTSPAPAP